ncbi:hypothetical protein N3K66_005909 [Trichothecium roseum]|uniref:Uncharacterized protein n=1 Tax=Trichothecium roseum TaxID=47278 RepID=A0ACC0V0K4_9HYPO|nr:hypothetical protein N3K66_005909 [Trichothecium roseum]
MATTNTQLDSGHRDHNQTSAPILPGSSKGPPKRLYNHPPALWDGLPVIDLDRLALREIDRRNALRSKKQVILKPKRKTNDIIRFARRGGPDLSHLRGYASIQDPRRDTQIEYVDWDEAGSSDSMMVLSTYNTAFECHLATHNVYTHGRNLEPDNLAELREALKKRRPSVSSSLTAKDYHAFVKSNDSVLTEQAVALRVMPKILGPDAAGYHCAEDLAMDGLARVVQGTPVPRPDYFDGVPYADVDPRIIAELKGSIVPMTHVDSIKCPLAPNFFLEIKGPKGGDPVILRRQICHYGSFGIRAMHALETVGRGQPAAADDDDDDGRATIPHVFTATYYSETAHLVIYCHYMSAPTTAATSAEDGVVGQGNPAYHMKLLKQYHLSDDFETFVQGVTALRNVRSMAKDVRDRLVEAANRSVREGKA